jgi:hypothetical protein
MLNELHSKIGAVLGWAFGFGGTLIIDWVHIVERLAETVFVSLINGGLGALGGWIVIEAIKWMRKRRAKKDENSSRKI